MQNFMNEREFLWTCRAFVHPQYWTLIVVNMDYLLRQTLPCANVWLWMAFSGVVALSSTEKCCQCNISEVLYTLLTDGTNGAAWWCTISDQGVKCRSFNIVVVDYRKKVLRQSVQWFSIVWHWLLQVPFGKLFTPNMEWNKTKYSMRLSVVCKACICCACAL